MPEPLVINRALWYVLCAGTLFGVIAATWARIGFWPFVLCALPLLIVVLFLEPRESRNKAQQRDLDCDCHRCTERLGGDTWTQDKLF